MGFFDFIKNLLPQASPAIISTPAAPAPASLPDVVQAAQPSSLEASPLKKRIISVLNVFENDSGSPLTEYKKIYLYHDGTGGIKQVTLARGYTECGGALWKVFERYARKGGKNAAALLAYKSKSGRGVLANDSTFLQLIKSSANEQSFRDAQDETFDDLYWDYGQAYADKWGFKLPLSLAVIQDSQLHSGGMLKFLLAKFPEVPPTKGGDEKEWIKQYVTARFKWLSNASEILSHTVYRPQFFLTQIRNDNWDFNPPMVANGVKIS